MSVAAAHLFVSLCLFGALAGQQVTASTNFDAKADHPVARRLTPDTTVRRRRLAGAAAAGVTPPDGQPFQMGTYTVSDIWVNPAGGNDANNGATRAAAKRTLTAAWAIIPARTTLGSSGYRIRITPGRLTEDMRPTYWDNRWGSQPAPIIVEAADGAGTVTIDGVNMYNCRHVYFIGVKFQLAGDHPFHCEQCTNLLLRNVTVAGICPSGYQTCGVQEAAKLNQCTGVWVEDSEIYNGWNAAFDCMACQYGHVLNSRIHSAGWCAFVKGGSAYWVLANNEVYDCLTSGMSAGQGSGFEYMVPPWLQYDVYDLKVYNNYVHDVTGAGLGVWGCYDCLFAHNTLLRVGRSSHTIEVNFGPRSCDGNNTQCTANYNAGGWGPTTAAGAAVNIPNLNVFFYNNLIYNPPGYQSQWQHIQVQSAWPSNTPRLPATVNADANLVFRGNMFWNGPTNHPLGLGDSTGCQPTNPTCSESLIRAQNYINTVQPVLTSAFRPAASSGLAGLLLLSASGFWLPTGQPFSIGTLSGMQHLWVDPVSGVDGAGRGGSRAAALKTLAAAWQLIPVRQQLTAGWYIHITPGSLGSTQMPNYWESRWGSLAAPVIIEAVDGVGTVTLASINAYDLRNVYFIGLKLQYASDVFHCEACTHLLLRNVTAKGLCPQGWSSDNGCGVQETIKLNQCRGVWIEGVTASGAWDNSFDCVACQYGHILNSKFSDSEWGVYLKGGSAYFVVSGNEMSSGGTTAFAAGQGTGFEFMSEPWIQYEAYDIKLVNNLIHDIDGAGFGVWGCYDCLFAHNTLVRVGARSHVIEVVFGSRSCDGDTARCSLLHQRGGWGPTSGEVPIPNKNVFILNNLVYNPPGSQSRWQHFLIDNPRTSGDSNLPGTQYADNNLVIRGNVIWNGGADMPLGINEAGIGGCGTSNPTCNAAQLRSQNAINTLQPDLNLSTFRPGSSGALASYAGLFDPIPAFGTWAATVSPGPSVPAGTLTNAVSTDMAGTARTAQRKAPGALLPP